MPERFWAGIWPSHFREWWHTETQGCDCRAEYIRADIAEQEKAELIQDVRDLLGWREKDYSGDRAKHAIEHMESKARAILAKYEQEKNDGPTRT